LILRGWRRREEQDMGEEKGGARHGRGEGRSKTWGMMRRYEVGYDEVWYEVGYEVGYEAMCVYTNYLAHTNSHTT
jgi:hypothetical protein